MNIIVFNSSRMGNENIRLLNNNTHASASHNYIIILKCVILQPTPTEEQKVIIKRAALDLRKECSDVVFPAVEKVISIMYYQIIFLYNGTPDQIMKTIFVYLYFHIERVGTIYI